MAHFAKLGVGNKVLTVAVVSNNIALTLNETTCQWEAPVAYPDDDNRYTWNETNQTWDIVE